MSLKKVLIIDDSRSFISVLRAHILNSYDYYEVVVAYSYQETQELLAQYPGEFFCAVVDIHLPDAPNGEAVELTLEHGIASIVFTGQFSDSLREDFLSLNVADYVLKQGQYNIDYVVKMIRRLDLNSEIKVLVVDDSRVARRMMRRLLTTQRYQVLETEDGEGALELVKEHDDIRLAIIDCHMDGMDGFTLASKLRLQHGHESLGIIGVSGQAGRSTSAQFIKSGANDFLLKPFSPEEFYCRVNQNVQLVEQFQYMQQLNEQKNRLLGMAAHDIRGPLSSIVSLCDLLTDSSLDPASSSQFINAIQHSSQDALDLLNNLLDISSIESGKFELDLDWHAIADLIEERVAIHQNHARRKDISLSVDLSQRPQLLYDPIRLKQVIDNLLSNAIKFSPTASEIQLALQEEDDGYQITVSDQGPGIDADEVQQLFGAYSRLSNQPTGGESSNGLGLAICHSIMQAHKGEIGVKPNPSGQGSCFYITLPKRQ